MTEPLANELANNMLELTENMAPIFDTAKGIRAQMEADGWSPTASETAALEWLTGAIGLMFRGAR